MSFDVIVPFGKFNTVKFKINQHSLIFAVTRYVCAYDLTANKKNSHQINEVEWLQSRVNIVPMKKMQCKQIQHNKKKRSNIIIFVADIRSS